MDISKIIVHCEFSDMNNVKDFFRLLSGYEYRLVGGVAVSFYVPERIPSKGDLDVILQMDDFDNVSADFRENGWLVQRGGYQEKFEYVAVIKGVDRFDILLDTNLLPDARYQMAGFKEVNVKIIEPEWLILLKIIAGREKDIHDILLLLNSERCNLEKLKSIVRKELGYPGLEELKSFEYMAKNVKKFSF